MKPNEASKWPLVWVVAFTPALASLALSIIESTQQGLTLTESALVLGAFSFPCALVSLVLFSRFLRFRQLDAYYRPPNLPRYYEQSVLGSLYLLLLFILSFQSFFLFTKRGATITR